MQGDIYSNLGGVSFQVPDLMNNHADDLLLIIKILTEKSGSFNKTDIRNITKCVRAFELMANKSGDDDHWDNAQKFLDSNPAIKNKLKSIDPKLLPTLERSFQVHKKASEIIPKSPSSSISELEPKKISGQSKGVLGGLPKELAQNILAFIPESERNIAQVNRASLSSIMEIREEDITYTRSILADKRVTPQQKAEIEKFIDDKILHRDSPYINSDQRKRAVNEKIFAVLGLNKPDKLKEWLDSKDIIKIALEVEPEIYLSLHEDLRKDPELAFTAVKYEKIKPHSADRDMLIFNHLDPSLKNNKDFLIRIFEVKPILFMKFIDRIDQNLRIDPKILETLLLNADKEKEQVIAERAAERDARIEAHLLTSNGDISDEDEDGLVTIAHTDEEDELGEMDLDLVYDTDPGNLPMIIQTILCATENSPISKLLNPPPIPIEEIPHDIMGEVEEAQPEAEVEPRDLPEAIERMVKPPVGYVPDLAANEKLFLLNVKMEPAFYKYTPERRRENIDFAKKAMEVNPKVFEHLPDVFKVNPQILKIKEDKEKQKMG